MSLAFPPSTVRVGILCENCQKIDFTEALNTPVRHDWSSKNPYQGLFIAVISQFSPSCDLCAELLSQRGCLEGLNLQLEDDQHYELRAFPLLETWSATVPTHISTLGTVWLHIIPVPFCSDATLCRSLRDCTENDGLLFVKGSADITDLIELKYWAESEGLLFVKGSADLKQTLHPLVLNRHFDAGRVRDWISTCKESHMKRCTPTASLPNLSLIDCTTLELYKFLTPPPYVALSYVWGQVAPATSTNPLEARAQPTLPPMDLMSQVIKDAISVTETLGFRFLWVDKYCVDQVDEKMKKHQIDNMDHIYSGAELTIIAASGEDEHHGLPGVSSERARAEPFTTGPFTIVRSPVMSSQAVGRSTWATRGWTFQEEFLSHRQLYFLTDQVFFVCQKMACHESLGGIELCSSPGEVAEYSHFTARTRYNECLSNLIGNELEITGYRLADYADLVELYTTRNLTFDEDALRAFAGIQRTFERGSHPIGAIYGLPIPLLDWMSTEDLETVITLGLCWQIHKKGEIRRRDSFPTWSWAAWAEPYFMPVRREWLQRRPQLQEICCTFDDGYTASLTEVFQSLLATVQSHESGRNHQHPCPFTEQAVSNPTRDWSSPRSLSFSAPCADIGKLFLSEDENTPHRYHLSTARNSEPIDTSSPLATSLLSSGLQSGEMDCLVLCTGDAKFVDPVGRSDLHLLIVEWTQPGEARRVGKLTLFVSANDLDSMEEHFGSLPRVQVRLW